MQNDSGAQGKFMRIKVRKIGEGVHHSEVVVEVTTVDGIERLVIPARSIHNDSLLVGAPIAIRKRGQILVELPREAMSGASRVWVKPDNVIADKGEARAA
jgi:hypothetical protein